MPDRQTDGPSSGGEPRERSDPKITSAPGDARAATVLTEILPRQSDTELEDQGAPARGAAQSTTARLHEGSARGGSTVPTPPPSFMNLPAMLDTRRPALNSLLPGDAELAPGIIIAGHFHLTSRLGVPSTFGEVWKAHDSALDRAVAIKVLKRELCTASLLGRFDLERQVMARMAHPNIAVVFECGTTDARRPYLVMELLAGEPLTTFCDARQLSTEERLRIFTGICRAVDYAHQIKVVHRDLKPGNILVVDGDEGPVAKVIDFGIAKVIDGGDFTAAGTLTMAYERVGTPYYMSPEQILPQLGPMGAPSDVYALGVILYELLVGETPFRPQTTLASRQEIHETIFAAILADQPERPSTRVALLGERMAVIATNRHIESRRLVSKLQGDLDAIVLRAIQKRPQERYASAGDLADDIGRHLRGEAVRARPGKWYRLGRFVRGHKAASAIGAAVLGTAAVSTCAYLATDAALTRESIALGKTEAARAEEAAAKTVAVAERSSAIAARDEATKARDAAEQARKVEVRARGEAEDLINYILFDLRDQLVPLGRTRLLESISAKAENYFQEQPVASDNDTLERNRGAMYCNRGLILLAQERNADAKTSFEKAIAIMERRHATRPGDPARRFDLARALDGRGLIQLDDGRDDLRALDTARQTFQRQLELLGPEGADPAGDPSLSLLRAGTLERLGDVELRASALASEASVANAALEVADGHFARQRAILSALGKERPGDPSVRQALAINREKAGKAATAHRRPEAALRCLEEAREIWRSLIEKTPGDLSLRSRLVVADGKVGDALLSRAWPAGGLPLADRARRALPGLQAALDAAADLARIDALNIHEQRELAAAHQRLAHALGELRRFDEALDHAGRDIALSEALAVKFPDRPLHQRDLAGGFIQRGQLYLLRARPSDLPAARTDFTRARDLIGGLDQRGRLDDDSRRLIEAASVALAELTKARAPNSKPHK